ncbi:MAG TPA: hypothetical protein VGE27_09405 [Gemmatimonas sp.]|uniref:DUF6941 family protein n=1 Tax=Gemmatimonas sp. TaxID=1962908 RepID=UPI002EDA574A
MNVTFALFADAANISQEGKLNILGIFDSVHVGQFPSLHPRGTLVLRLKASPADQGTHQLALRWTNPRGVELWTSQAELEIGPPVSNATEVDMPIIVQLDLPLDIVGDYRMTVTIDERPQTIAVLHVRGGAAPMVPPATGQMMS